MQVFKSQNDIRYQKFKYLITNLVSEKKNLEHTKPGASQCSDTIKSDGFNSDTFYSDNCSSGTFNSDTFDSDNFNFLHRQF